MKKNILSSLLIGVVAFCAGAECMVPLSVIASPKGDAVPEECQEALESRLTSAVAATGVAVADPSNRFFIAGRFNHLNTGTLVGPPIQYTMSSQLTLYIGDLMSQTIFATETLAVKGSGASEKKAFLNAIRLLSGKSPQLLALIDKGRDRIISYYDENGAQLLTQAEKVFKLGNFEEALFISCQIPECSRSYADALPLIERYYQAYADEEGRKLYEAALGNWSMSPNVDGANKAFAELAEIPVASSYRPKAENLVAEMKTKLKDDEHFQTRTLYADDLNLQKQELEVARQVGVAYGNGQQPQTTNLNWIR